MNDEKDRFEDMNYVLVFGKEEEDGIQIYHAVGYHEEPTEEEMHADIHEMTMNPSLFPFMNDESTEARLFLPGQVLEDLKGWMRGANPTIIEMNNMNMSMTPKDINTTTH